MIPPLTNNQINYLKDIKDSGKPALSRQGKHMHCHGTEALWHCLYEYLRIIQKTRFKISYFNKDFLYITYARKTSMNECPLSYGELVHAVKYGFSTGFLRREGHHENYRYYLTETVLKHDGFQKEKQ
jgi:hypothetical protein